MTDATADDTDDTWAEATRQVHALAENGKPIRFVSLQASMVLMLAFMSALGVFVAVGGGSSTAPLAVILLVLAMTFSISGYVNARRSGRLFPFVVAPPAPVLKLLTREDRRTLNRQWRRSVPMDARSAPLIAALVAFNTESNKTLVLSLVGLACGLLGVALSLAPIFAGVIAGCVVVMTVLFLWEARQLRRLANDASAFRR